MFFLKELLEFSRNCW